MQQLGLIGYPLTHSFSADYFTRKFAREGLSTKYRYDNFPLADLAALEQLFADYRDTLLGLNVTIPYKEQVIPYLDELHPAARTIGAVNTIHCQSDGRRIGYNTDVIGFRDSLLDFLATSGGPARAALILGTGGAAKAVAWVLAQLQIPYQYVSRKPQPGQLSYAQLDKTILEEHDLIVNTTPLGMAPKLASCPDIPYHYMNKMHRLYDLVYNPAETLFLQRGAAQGAAICNGLAMLHGQAEAAWRIWTN
ncbi:MAG: shikimate dehydrogenase [Bacteroidetes bacterium]|nr:MAG: shikimate dehydrogenase [Bacteroidota bacterium]